MVADLLLLSGAAGFAQQKRIYIAPDDHTDYMWTADEETYTEAILSMLDYYIDLNDATSAEPYPYRSKWNCDGSWWIRVYEENRTEEQFQKLIEQLKAGSITAPLNTLESVMGVAPIEAILRDMYYAGSLERKYGIDFQMALNMEDQVLPWGLSSLWAGSGARYSWRGVCSCVTQVRHLDNREHEIYWYTGPDGKRVLMKWYSVNPEMITNPNVFRYNLGKYLEADNMPNAIKDLKELLEDTDRYPYDAAGAFGMGGDNLKTLRRDFLQIARDSTDIDFQVYISNGLDFFKDIETNYGKSIPSESVSYGSTEWGTAMASMAELSASVKRSIEKLRAAELMYAIAAIEDNDFCKDLVDARRDAWFACGKFFEHDWTADSPDVSRKQRGDWQRRTAGQLISYVDTLYDRSLRWLEDSIAGKGDGSFFVLNPLGWKRSDVCDVAYDGSWPVSVREIASGKTLPCQKVIVDGKSYARFIAAELPPFGYRCYSLVNEALAAETQITVSDEGTVENGRYRIVVDRQGNITSLFDKICGRELISEIDGLFANDLGRTKRKPIVRGSNIQLENVGPLSVTLLARSYFPVKHTSRISLYSGMNRVDVENVIEENFGNNLTTYAFSFNLDNPVIRTEEAGAIVDVRQQSQGGDYADDICRLDWVAMNHFADISSGDCGVVLSNRDALFMKTGHSTVDSLDMTTPQINVLVGGKVNSWLGIEYQDGDDCFHNNFSLLSYDDGYDPERAMKFSLEHQNPLVVGRTASGGSMPAEYSLIDIEGDGIVPWCVKPCEDGIEKGLVVRAWNVSDIDASCKVSSGNARIKSAKTATHIEVPKDDVKVRNGKFEYDFGHNSLETFLVLLYL